MKKRLIDADALKRRIANYRMDCTNSATEEDMAAASAFADCIAEIDGAPAVEAAEVVRCEDCRTFSKANGYKCDYSNMPVSTDDYCSHGERKAGTK